MADKIKKFLTDNKGCPLTPAATKQLFVKFLEFLVKEGYGEELEALKNGGLQYGSYIYKDTPEEHFEFVEEIPADYSGLTYSFDTDGLYIEYYEDGTQVNYVYISPNSITIYTEGNSVSIEGNGINKVQPSALVGLTHSFNELDPTLKQIVDDSLDTGTSVACTQTQWDNIKQLLDKSLYLNYDGYLMIKNVSEINHYIFGCYGGNYGFTIEMFYDLTNNTLEVKYHEQ